MIASISNTGDKITIDLGSKGTTDNIIAPGVISATDPYLIESANSFKSLALIWFGPITLSL